MFWGLNFHAEVFKSVSKGKLDRILYSWHLFIFICLFAACSYLKSEKNLRKIFLMGR